MLSRSLTVTLLRYVDVFMVQGSQTALANGFYGVPEAEYTRSMGAGRGRNPDSIPAFSSTQPEVL